MATEPSTSESTTAAASPQPEQGTTASASARAAVPPPPGATSATPAAPHPLDGLSPTDLRIKLDHARKHLRQHLDKKRKLDRELAQLEQSIYAFEGSYLSDALFPATANSTTAGGAGSQAGAAAAQFGNIIRGYDSYLKAPSASAQDRKRFRPGDPPSDKERMFSASSATFHRSVELRAAETAASMSVEPESDDDYGTSSRRKQRGRH